MNFSWTIFIDLGLISLALLIATLIRAKVSFFQRYLIPNALTAGFILLPFYNFLAPRLGLATGGLENLVYHLLSISFIAMSLRKSPGRGAFRRIFSTSIAIVSQYTFQALLGFGLTFLLIATVLPNLFPSLGLLLPLGYGLGPGQSFAIGRGWERFGFESAANVGLTFAALGFLWACFGGVFLINYGIRRGWMEEGQIARFRGRGIRIGVYDRKAEKPVGARLTTETEAIDAMSFNLAVVLGVYLLTYLLLQGLTSLLSLAGSAGRDLAVNLWGISFAFAALVAMAVKKIADGAGFGHVLDSGSLTRISGASVDVLVAASIGAISLVVVSRYWLPIVGISTLGGIMVVVTVLAMTSRIFEDHQFYRAMMVYGACTGTASTGLALLRVLDPEFESPVAADYMYSSGIIFLLSIPLILMLNLPAYGHQSGNPVYYWITLGILLVYLVFVTVSYVIMSKERAFKNTSIFWKKAA